MSYLSGAQVGSVFFDKSVTTLQELSGAYRHRDSRIRMDDNQ